MNVVETGLCVGRDSVVAAARPGAVHAADSTCQPSVHGIIHCVALRERPATSTPKWPEGKNFL